MIKRLFLRIQYVWMLACKKKPVRADVFITREYNKEKTTQILHKDWPEVETLWNKLLSWEAFVLAYGPKVKYDKFLNLSAGWKKIYYE